MSIPLRKGVISVDYFLDSKERVIVYEEENGYPVAEPLTNFVRIQHNLYLNKLTKELFYTTLDDELMKEYIREKDVSS